MPIYQWDGDSWRNINSVWQWNGDSWRQINSGWQWDGDSWRQFFSSGTFQPEIRNTSGDVINNSSVGNTLVGYRGSNVSGTYTFAWQYRVGTNAANAFVNQGGAGATGTLTGGTLTTNYVTDASDLVAIETAAYSYTLNTRFRVTKSSETVSSNVVRIRKRTPVRLVNIASGARGFNSFATTYNALTNEPYPTDRIDFWSSTAWQSTTNLTNDTRPDYYIFTIATGTSTYTRDSRTLDSSNPRTPTNSARYTVQNGDIGETIRVTIVAYNSSTGSPVTATTTTQIVDNGLLKAPTNLVLSESDSNPGKLDLRWNPSLGGNDTTITYQWQIYRDDVFITSGTTTSGGNPIVAFYPAASGVFVTTAGVYKFRVTASQSGQSTVTSGFSNTVNVTAPGTFTIDIDNRTSDLGRPTTFTIDAFEADTGTLNRYNTSWSSAGSRVTNYTSRWTRPDNSVGITNNVLNRTDYWPIFQSGTHTLEVTATNDRYQYIRIDWTPATNAQSYTLVYRLYNNPRGAGLPGSNITVNFDSSTTFFDLAFFDNDLYWAVEVVSVTAYRFADQIGPSRIVTGSSISNTQVVATRAVTRSQSLTFITVSAGSVTISGTPEVFEFLTYSLSGWSPPASNAEWTFEHTWGRTNLETQTANTYTKGSNSSIIPAGADIGENILIRVRGTFRGTTTSYVFDSSPTILPYPPTYTLTNNFDLTFTIDDLTSNGASSYFGTYTGGTVANTSLAIGTVVSVPTEGTKTVSLFARLRKTISGVSQLFDSARSRTQTINVQEIAAFNWTPSDTTVVPTTPGAVTVTFTDGQVNLNWADAANATSYNSNISGGTQGFRTNIRSTSDDNWAVTNGGVSYSGNVTSRNTNGRMLIDWPVVSGAGSYRVLFTIEGTTSNVLTTSTNYTITTTTGNAISNIRVRAYANTGGTGVFREGSPAIPFSTTQTPQTKLSADVRSWSGTSLSAPATPTGMSATATSSSSVSLSWNASARASTYEWYWTTSSTFTPNNSTVADFSGLTGTTATHSGRTSGTTYYYWVRARNSIGVSGWSNRASATTSVSIPSVPTGVTSTYNGTNFGVYQWSASWNSVSGATTYDYQWQFGTTSTGGTTNTINGSTSSTSTSTSNADKPYARFRVRATNSAGSSAYSGYTAWS
jgi:hypothetical protein